MTIGDNDLSPMDAHRLEVRAAMRRQHEDDLAAQLAEYREQQAIESPEGEEARWSHTFAAMAKDREAERTYWPPRSGIDSRLFGP